MYRSDLMELLAELSVLVQSPPNSIRDLYSKVAPRYGRFRDLRLALAVRAQKTRRNAI